MQIDCSRTKHRLTWPSYGGQMRRQIAAINMALLRRADAAPTRCYKHGPPMEGGCGRQIAAINMALLWRADAGAKSLLYTWPSYGGRMRRQIAAIHMALLWRADAAPTRCYKHGPPMEGGCDAKSCCKHGPPMEGGCGSETLLHTWPSYGGHACAGGFVLKARGAET